MSFYKQFENFDPVKGTLPVWPFREARAIAARARSLVHGRSAKDIQAIAEDAYALIEEFFDVEKTEALRMLVEEERFDLLDIDSDGHAERISDLATASAEYDIRTTENTSDVDALQEAIQSMLDPSAIEVPDVKKCEYFAALALCLLGEFSRAAEWELDVKSGKVAKRNGRSLDPADVSRMGSLLIDAMESVCYGERLRDEARTNDKYEKRIHEVQAAHKELSEQDRDRIRAEAMKQVEEEAKARRVQQAKDNNRLRHQENNDVKKLVLDAWEKDPSRFASAEKAADHFADALEVNGTPRSHRTVVDWIRAHAKEKGIRLR